MSTRNESAQAYRRRKSNLISLFLTTSKCKKCIQLTCTTSGTNALVSYKSTKHKLYKSGVNPSTLSTLKVFSFPITSNCMTKSPSLTKTKKNPFWEAISTSHPMISYIFWPRLIRRSLKECQSYHMATQQGNLVDKWNSNNLGHLRTENILFFLAISKIYIALICFMS